LIAERTENESDIMGEDSTGDETYDRDFIAYPGYWG
jgi:hypothetical protein